ncbi:MAG: hypothetical protein U0271_19925 [Polyangiaceae bacterium]
MQKLTSLALLFSVVACGSSPPREPAPQRAIATASAPAASAAPEPAPEPEPVASTEPVPSSPPPPPPPAIAAFAQEMPSTLKLDGATDEWTGFKTGPRGTTGAAVAVALSERGAVIAGELAKDSSAGVIVLLGMPSDGLPPIGYYQRGGGLKDINCESNFGMEPTDESRAKCEALLKRYDDLTAEVEAKTTFAYRVEPTGVTLLQRNQAPRLLKDVKVAWQASADGARFEVAVPPALLPRAGDSPVSQLRLAALAPTTAVADLPAREALPLVTLTAPAHVVPKPELLDAAYALERHNSRSFFYYAVPRFSYQPGDGTKLEVISHAEFDTTKVVTREEPLFRSLGKVGKFEIGLLNAGWTTGFIRGGSRMASLCEEGGDYTRPEDLTEAQRADPDFLETLAQTQFNGDNCITPDVAVSRGAGLHAISFEEAYQEDSSLTSAAITVLEVDAKGESKLLLDAHKTCQHVEIHHAKDYSTMDILCTNVFGDGTTKKTKYVWKYSAKQNAYDESEPVTL